VFTREGYARAEPAILQPADIFLDVSGEDLRKRMFVTQDGEGREWCLRPEFTIPVCRDHLAGPGPDAAGRYAYLGPVFRMRRGEPGEFQQCGIESIGRDDREAADAEVLALTCEALALAGLDAPAIQLGDVAILKAALAALKVPTAPARRLMRAVSAGAGADAVAALTPQANGHGQQQAGLIAALQGQDPQAARRFVEDVLSIAGISRVGGRTAGDIAGRFLAQAAARDGLAAEVGDTLSRLLAIAGDPDEAAASLRALAAERGLALDAELDALEARTGFIAARGLDVGAMRFGTGFARNLDYYTSFIFEIHDPRPDAPKPVAGGGRYDGLMQQLGAPGPSPCVGVSIWLDRLPASAQQPSPMGAPDDGP
jgi:ATP phosphoribosyltransferase regulatory subunit